MSSVKEILSQIGIKITSTNDSGFAQFAPIYRGSTNQKGASINLKTGWTSDWSEGSSFPIEVLVKRVTGEELSEQDISQFESLYEEKDEKEQDFWKEESLIRFLPNHKYWMDRGISKETLDFFKGGVSHSGKLYQRYVWPVYDRLDRIIGFTGRDITNKSDIKYKHEGRSTYFLFGLFNRRGESRPVLESILSKSEIILVEGPSDSVACFDEGVYNVLPTIGLNISPTLMSFLLGVNPNKITICYNKDEKFSGQNAAVKNFAKLAEHFDLDKLAIKYPIGNDLADNKEKIKEWLDMEDNSAIVEFREKYKRLDKVGKKMTKQEMKIGKELGKCTCG